MTLELEDLQQLANNRWYSELPTPFQQSIVQHARVQHYEKDQAIFYSGDRFDGIYAVLEGAVRLGYVDIEGTESIAAIVEPIMWFGEISLIDQQPRSHDAIAIRTARILHIPDAAIHTLLAVQPKFWFHIAQLTSQKLRMAFLELISIQTRTIRQRLALRLMLILHGYGNHILIEKNVIQLSQEQLAQMLTCSRQTINQELQALEKLGVLKLAFKKIEIIDQEQLHRLAYTQHS